MGSSRLPKILPSPWHVPSRRCWIDRQTRWDKDSWADRIILWALLLECQHADRLGENYKEHRKGRERPLIQETSTNFDPPESDCIRTTRRGDGTCCRSEIKVFFERKRYCASLSYSWTRVWQLDEDKASHQKRHPLSLRSPLYVSLRGRSPTSPGHPGQSSGKGAERQKKLSDQRDQGSNQTPWRWDVRRRGEQKGGQQ